MTGVALPLKVHRIRDGMLVAIDVAEHINHVGVLFLTKEQARQLRADLSAAMVADKPAENGGAS